MKRTALLLALALPLLGEAQENPRRTRPLDPSAPPTAMLVQTRTVGPAEGGGSCTTLRLELRMSQGGQPRGEAIRTERLGGCRPLAERIGPVAPGTPPAAVVGETIEDRALPEETLRGVRVQRRLRRMQFPAVPQFRLSASINTVESWRDPRTGQLLRTIESNSSSEGVITTDYMALPNAEGLAPEWFTPATGDWTVPPFR